MTTFSDELPEGTTDPPTIRAVEMVAQQVEKDAVELPPLGERVDSDAIDAVVETIDDGHVSFRYHGFQITIDASKSVSVEPEA